MILISTYEDYILNILLKNKVVFEREKRFPDFKNGKYRFDFYLSKNNTIIEVQGEQHYKYVSAFYKNRSDFLKAKGRDRSKINYCLSKNIKIYCIPFWEIKKIQSINEIFKKEFLAINQYHNDEAWRKYQNSLESRSKSYLR